VWSIKAPQLAARDKQKDLKPKDLDRAACRADATTDKSQEKEEADRE
jgi:hypothetical protein